MLLNKCSLKMPCPQYTLLPETLFFRAQVVIRIHMVVTYFGYVLNTELLMTNQFDIRMQIFLLVPKAFASSQMSAIRLFDIV